MTGTKPAFVGLSLHHGPFGGRSLLPWVKVMRYSAILSSVFVALSFTTPLMAQDSLTAVIKSVSDKGKITLNDGSVLAFDPAKVEVVGTPEVGAKIAVVFSGDENGYEISKIVVTK